VISDWEIAKPTTFKDPFHNSKQIQQKKLTKLLEKSSKNTPEGHKTSDFYSIW
jgi:hypothetical protein